MVNRHALGAAAKKRGNGTVTLAGKSFTSLDFDSIKGKCKGFVYITKNNVNGMLYIGIHTQWNKDYLGSGSYIKQAFKEYGKSAFTRYIIDTADTQEELERKEANYIQNYFGYDCTKSPQFYNITSGLQRGGNTFSGMHPIDKARREANISEALREWERSLPESYKETRSKLHHEIAVENYAKHPDYRKHVSEGTKKGMTEAVRQHLSDIQKGVPKPYKSEEAKEKARNRMSKVGKSNVGKRPWNKDVPMKDSVKRDMLDRTCVWYRVYINDKVIIKQVSNMGGLLHIAQEVGKYFGVDSIGRNCTAKLISSGAYYIHKVKSKSYMDGLHFERIGEGLDYHGE